MDLFLFLFGIFLGVESMGHTVILSHVFEEQLNFPTVTEAFTFPSATYKVPSLPHNCQYLLIFYNY